MSELSIHRRAFFSSRGSYVRSSPRRMTTTTRERPARHDKNVGNFVSSVQAIQLHSGGVNSCPMGLRSQWLGWSPVKLQPCGQVVSRFVKCKWVRCVWAGKLAMLGDGHIVYNWIFRRSRTTRLVPERPFWNVVRLGGQEDFCANYFNFKLISFSLCFSLVMVRIQNEFARIRCSSSWWIHIPGVYGMSFSANIWANMGVQQLTVGWVSRFRKLPARSNKYQWEICTSN